MRRIKRVLAVPSILILELFKVIINLLIKAECWVAGVGFLLLAIFAILALINQMWLQLGIFLGLVFLLVLILFFSANVLFWIGILEEHIQHL